MEHFQEDENICLSSNCLHLCLHLLLYLYLQKLSGIPPCNLSARPPAQHLDEQEVAGKWSQVSKLFRCFFPKLNLLLLILQYFEILQETLGERKKHFHCRVRCPTSFDVFFFPKLNLLLMIFQGHSKFATLLRTSIQYYTFALTMLLLAWTFSPSAGLLSTAAANAS